MSFINNHSRLTIDPCIHKAAKEVMRYAQEVARKSDHAASDLLITAVWSCMNCSCSVRNKPWPENVKKTANKQQTAGCNNRQLNKGTGQRNASVPNKATQDKRVQPTAGRCENKNTAGSSCDVSKKTDKSVHDKNGSTDSHDEETDDIICLDDEEDVEECEIEHDDDPDGCIEISKTKSGIVIEKQISCNNASNKHDDLFDMDCEEIDDDEENQLLYGGNKAKEKEVETIKTGEKDIITITKNVDNEKLPDDNQTMDNFTKSKQNAGKDDLRNETLEVTNTGTDPEVINLDSDSEQDEAVISENSKTNTNTVTVKIENDTATLQSQSTVCSVKVEPSSPSKDTTECSRKEENVQANEASTTENDITADVKEEDEGTNEPEIESNKQPAGNIHGGVNFPRIIITAAKQSESHPYPKMQSLLAVSNKSSQPSSLSQPSTSQSGTAVAPSNLISSLGIIPQAVSQPHVQKVLVPSMLGLVPLHQTAQETGPQPNSITATTITYYTEPGQTQVVPCGQEIRIVERQALITNTGESPPSKMRLLDFDKKWHTAPKYDKQQEKYLALPGGVEGNSIESGEERRRKLAVARDTVSDWIEPGLYTSISNYPTVPTVQMENVGEMIAQGHGIPHSAADNTNKKDGETESDVDDEGEDMEEEESSDEEEEVGTKSNKGEKKTVKKGKTRNLVNKKGKAASVTTKRRKSDDKGPSVRGGRGSSVNKTVGRGRGSSSASLNDKSSGKYNNKVIVKILGTLGKTRGTGRGQTRGRGRAR